MEVDLAELSFIDLGGVLTRHGRNLVADRDQRIETLLACDVEIVLKLLGLQLVLAGLDFDQGCPSATARTTRMRPSG